MPHKSIPDRIIRFCIDAIPKGSSIVIAVSGGSDSVALMFMLFELRERLGITDLVVAHLNHGLRGKDSDLDECLVKDHADRLKLPCFTRRLQGHRLEEAGLEAAARDARYKFLHDIRIDTGCTHIATGHTMDDQAETVLMRLMRGCGINGLRGIVQVRKDTVLRPLLMVPKRDLVAWLSENQIPFRNDTSNNDCRFFRNQVRHRVLPLLEKVHPGAISHIAALASCADNQWRLYHGAVSQWINQYFVMQSSDFFHVDSKGFEDRHLAAEGLREVFSQRGIPTDRYHIENVIENSSRIDGTFLLPAGWRYLPRRGVVVFERFRFTAFNYVVAVPGSCRVVEERRTISISIETSKPVVLDRGKEIAFIDGAELGSSCCYRTIMLEDTFIPFGTSQEIAINRFLAKQGMKSPFRQRVGCLFSADNKPVWIAGIRLDERFRVTSATRKVIKLQSESFLY